MKWNVSAAEKEVICVRAKDPWFHPVSAIYSNETGDICDLNLGQQKRKIENFDFKISTLKLQERSNRGTIQGSIEHFFHLRKHLPLRCCSLCQKILVFLYLLTWCTAIELHPQSKVVMAHRFHDHNWSRYRWQRNFVSLNRVCISVSSKGLKM